MGVKEGDSILAMSNDIDKCDRAETSLIRQASPQYEDIYDINHIYRTFNQVRKASHYKPPVQSFYWYQLRYSYLLSKDLREETYQPQETSEFLIRERGKVREIKANTVNDRVVNAVIDRHVLQPLTEPRLIYDNGASRKNLGTSHTRKRIDKHLHDAMFEFGEDATIILFDISNYFGSIPVDELLNLYHAIIDDPKCYEALRKQLKAHNLDERGVGIGSIISQNAGIFYLHKFDNYVKIVLGRKYYGRFMDDFYIICKNKTEAKELKPLIIDYIESKLHLTVNKKKTQTALLTHGFKFLKFFYRVSPTGKIYKRQDGDTFIRERRKIKRFKNTKMTEADIEESYKSWRGSLLSIEYNKPRLNRTDKLFKKLYPNLDYKLDKEEKA